MLFLVASTSPTKPGYADLRSLALQDLLPVARSPGTLWQVRSGEEGRQYHSHSELYRLGAWLIASPR